MKGMRGLLVRFMCMCFLSVPFPPKDLTGIFFFFLFPDLLSKPEAKYIFGEVVSEHNSGSGDEDEDMGMSSPDKQKPGLSFEGYLWCLAYVAIESALWPIEDKNGSGPGPSEEHQVFALLQWMDRSSGKKKLARNGRCSAVIGPFRCIPNPTDIRNTTGWPAVRGLQIHKQKAKLKMH